MHEFESLAAGHRIKMGTAPHYNRLRSPRKLLLARLARQITPRWRSKTAGLALKPGRAVN